MSSTRSFVVLTENDSSDSEIAESGTSPILSPSGSESLASTGIDTVRPGRTATVSLIALGAWFVPGLGAMPTRTVPIDSAPKVSTTR